MFSRLAGTVLLFLPTLLLGQQRQRAPVRIQAIASAHVLPAARTSLAATILKTRLMLPAPQRLLDIQFKNPSTSGRAADWAAATCNRSRFLQGADYEWTSVLAPGEQVETREIGATGLLINEHTSEQDLWFTHPYGTDWNANLLLDTSYNFLLAPGTPASDEETMQAVNQAKADGFSDAQNAFHVEFDGGMIPAYYRAEEFDDVAMFGRWIVDCGHTNFTTEMHPPLLFVKAHGDWDPNAGVTHATVVTRPFLVAQTFGGKPLRQYLLDQLVRLYTFPCIEPISCAIVVSQWQLQARPDITPLPFGGIQIMVFTIRPQFPRRAPTDKLQVRYFLSERTGVAVQLVPMQDSLQVWVVMNEASYVPAASGTRTNVSHPLPELQAAQPDVGSAIQAIEAGGAFSLNPAGDAVLQKGFDTDAYLLPAFGEPPLGSFADLQSISSPSNQRFQHNDFMPWPLIGTIELKWTR